MFNEISNSLKCSFCEEGNLYYNQRLTFIDYTSPTSFTLDDIDDIVDGIINQYLVYECDNCGSYSRFTMRDLEKKIRKHMSAIAMTLISNGTVSMYSHSVDDKVMIYCGKCNGMDGNGACSANIYKECKLKRLPSGL